MSKRILSVVLSLVLLLSAVSVTGIITSAATNFGTPVLTVDDLPDSPSLITGKTPAGKGDGTTGVPNTNASSWTQATDGLIQGVNQKAKWKLTESPTYTYNNTQYMQPLVPADWVAENYPELDANKAWYLSMDRWGPLSDIPDTRTTTYSTSNAADGRPIYDLGQVTKVKQVMLAISAEIVGISDLTGKASSDGTSNQTITAEKLEAGLVPKAVSASPNNTFYKVNVYVADKIDANILSEDNLVLSWDNTNAKTSMSLAAVYDVDTVKSGRYICIDFRDCNYSSLTRVSELAVYGEKAFTVEAVTTLPNKPSLLAGKTAVTAMDGKNSINVAPGNLGVAGLTDGVLAAAEGVNRVGLYPDGATKMYYDLGSTKEIAQFLIGSEADANYYIKTVRIYVGDDKDTLFASANLAVAVSGIAAQNVLLSMGDTIFKGQYVGFDFTGNNHPYFLRFGELGAYAAVAEDTNYTLYNATDAPAAMTPAADNVLASATGTGYRTDKGGNSTDPKMLTKLVDGIISSENGDKLCPTTDKDTGISYYYFTYDMGKDYTIDSLTYAGDGSTGANSVGVYVGDKDLTNVVGTEPDAFYDGGIGDDFVTNNNTKSQAIRFDFAEALTGRYITFRLGVCRNSNYDQVWISEFAATGSKVGGSGKPYTLYTSDNAAANMTPAADNVLASATGTGYRTDKGGNSTDPKMLTKLVDGIISSENGDKLCPTTDKDTGISYYYFTYDMGKDYTIDSLTYAGDGSTGANSVGVYVGDKDLTNVVGTEPDAFYDGGIGDGFVTNNNTKSQAIRFDFAEALTGRYITFRLGVCRNSNYDQVWISEFAATGSKVGGSGKAYAVIDDESDLPQDTNLIASTIPTKADGTKVNPNSGTLSAVTDGKIPGINQDLPTFTLTQEDQYKTAKAKVSGVEHTYYSWIAPTSLVEAQGLDTTKTWYMRPQSGRWLHTNGGEQSASLGSGADSRPVFDMGNTASVESLLFGSVTELTGCTNSNYYDGAYDASKHLTMSDTQLATASTPLSADKRLLWTAKVYVGNDRATIFDDSNKVLEFDLSDALNDAWCTLWTLPEAVQGRYVAFDFNDALYSDLVRVSELAVYGERVVQDLKPGVNVVSMANFPNIPANLLQGSTKQVGTLNKNTAPLEVLYDGNIGGINVAAGGDTRVVFDGNNGGTITTADGKTVTKVNGTVNVAFQLENTSTIDKILVAGSAADDTNHKLNGVSYDNRNVLYYEVYVSDSYATLYNEGNRVLAYDNSEDPQLALIHVLDTPVRGSYVGFKLSCGVYSLGRFSELGVYGTMDPLALLPFTGFDSESEMNALVNGQKNLILGEGIANLPSVGYLPHIGSATLTNEAWLSDGHIDWTKVAEGESYKKNEYGNANSDQTIVYDLLGEVDFSGLLISGTGVEESQFRPQRVTVYVSDDDKTLFDSDNLAGVAMLRGANVGAYIDLASADAQGRYIGLMIPGDTSYRIVRIAELGIYGTYVSGPAGYPVNLLAGTLPVYQKEISARSIDNKTAVDVNGHPGSGNTGAFTGEVKTPWRYDDLALLTDGSTSTRASLWSSASPTGAVHEQGTNILHYDSNWMVFVYKLSGGTRIDEIAFSSSPERDYYISGVQYYASEAYADLFKNESLLYTTGGEYYVVDEENSTEEETKYLPDASMDKNDEQTITYMLTDEQKATNYRYVAIVLTRPHSMWKPTSPSNRLVGYNMFRAAEMAVYGEVVNPEAPIKDTYTVDTSVGEVTLQIGTLHFDDRAFFDNTLAGIKVTETKLPADVIPNTDDNWLSVDNDTVFTFQMVDKNGDPIPEIAADEAGGLNGREMEFQFPSTADYVQTMGVLEDGVLRRLYNSFTNVQNDRKINAGCLVYPTYDEGMPNNRDKATLSGTKISLVYMKANDYATVNKLSNRVVNDSLADFVAAGGVDGASAEATPVSPLWYILPALAVVGAAAVTAVCLKRRKAFRAGQ